MRTGRGGEADKTCKSCRGAYLHVISRALQTAAPNTQVHDVVWTEQNEQKALESRASENSDGYSHNHSLKQTTRSRCSAADESSATPAAAGCCRYTQNTHRSSNRSSCKTSATRKMVAETMPRTALAAIASVFSLAKHAAVEGGRKKATEATFLSPSPGGGDGAAGLFVVPFAAILL